MTSATHDLAPTGSLRASINLGNPVLAQGTPEDPTGVTVDLARALGERLGVPVELLCFTAARDSFAALTDGRADVGFLAIEPARAKELFFTPEYVVIRGFFVVADDSPVASPEQVDRPGVRIGVKRGSAYDLFLTRTLKHAEIVRGDEGVDVYLEEHLDVGAGIFQPLKRWVEAHPGHRLVPPHFMEIPQSVATPRDRGANGKRLLHKFVVDHVISGFVNESLERSGGLR